MMMRMLAAGGLPVLCDSQRPADADNPRGYFELEAVKNTAADASWVERAPGNVVKVISFVLPHLPRDREYRVLFLRRPLDQIVRSQRVMLERRGEPLGPNDSDAYGMLAEHLVDIDTWRETARHLRWLGVNYERVLAEPRRESARIAAFFEVELDVDAMASTIELALHRQR
jgi:hypothetical protein